MEPLYYLIHRECRYVSDSATRSQEAAEARRGDREAIVFVVGATEAGGTQGCEKEKRTRGGKGQRDGRAREKTGVDSVMQRCRGRSGKLGRGWSEGSLSRGQAAT